MSTRTRGIGRILDGLYATSHALACLSIASLATLIIVQVFGRLIDKSLRALGLPALGMQVPSLAEIGGFLFVAGTFLALASTLRHGVHIRVTLLLEHVPDVVARALRVMAALIGAVLFAYASWHAIDLVRDSIRFNEVSFGIVAVPLAIPQAAMAAGLCVFTIALLHEAAISASGSSTEDGEAESAKALAAGTDSETVLRADAEPAPAHG